MPPQNQHNGQYDFIMSSEHTAKKTGVSLPSGNSQRQRIAIFGGIILLVFFFLFFLMSIMKSGGEDKAQYVTLINKQTELARVTGLATADPSISQATKNAATNIQTVTTSDRQLLIATLAKKGVEFKEKDLVGVADTATDQRLASAKAAATYSSTLLTVINEQFNRYRSELAQLHDKTKSQSIKQTLAQAYEHTNILEKQLVATKP